MRRRTSSSSQSQHDSPPPIDLRRVREEEAAAARSELGPHEHKRRRPPLPCPTMGRSLTQRPSFSSASSSTTSREETRPCPPPSSSSCDLSPWLSSPHFREILEEESWMWRSATLYPMQPVGLTVMKPTVSTDLNVAERYEVGKKRRQWSEEKERPSNGGTTS